MPATHITKIVFNYLFGRALRRAMLVALIGVFTLTAIYHFTIVGTLALEAQYGLLYAHLIVAAAYSTATLITAIILWAMRTKRPKEKQMAAARAAPRNAQIAMLIEAGMLGYTFGRKSGHRIH